MDATPPSNLVCPKCASRDALQFDGSSWYCARCDGTMDGDTVYVDATAVVEDLGKRFTESTGYGNAMDSVPEGLTLQYTDTANFEPGIVDAQDMVWVHFPDHDTEDPTAWFRAIVRNTCTGLGVTSAINEQGDEVTVEEFIAEWIGYHESGPNSGFTT